MVLDGCSPQASGAPETAVDIKAAAYASLEAFLKVRTHSKNQKYLCPICADYSTINKAEILDHINSKHVNHHFPCTASGCESTFTSKNTLGKHVKLRHSSLFMILLLVFTLVPGTLWIGSQTIPHASPRNRMILQVPDTRADLLPPTPVTRPNHNLRPRPEIFFGRDAELGEIHRRMETYLDDRKGPSFSLVTSSSHGGQTTFALEVAYASGVLFQKRWWLRGAHLAEDIQNILWDGYGIRTNEQEPAALLAILGRSALSQPTSQPCLVLISDISPSINYTAHLPVTGVYTLLTSASAASSYPASVTVNLPELTADDLLDFVNKSGSDSAKFQAHLTGNVFTIPLLNKYAIETGVSFEDALHKAQWLMQKNRNLRSWPSAVWEMTSSEIKSRSEPDLLVAELSSLLTEGPIPREWFPFAWTSPLQRPGTLLASFGVIQFDEGSQTFAMLPELQEVIRGDLAADKLETRFAHLAHLLERHLAQFSLHHAKEWNSVSRAVAHGDAFVSTNTAHLDPAEVVSLAFVLGQYHLQVIGDPKDAARLFLLGLKADLKAPLGLQPALLAYLAMCAAEEGETATAARYARRAAAEVEKFLVPETQASEEAMEALTVLAAYHQKYDAGQQSMKLLEKAYQFCRKLYGENTAHEIQILVLLGQEHRLAGQLERAGSYFSEAQELLSLLDLNHSLFAAILYSDYSRLLGERGENEEALGWAIRARNENERLLGSPRRMEVIRMDAGIARLLSEAGKHEEALVFAARAYGNTLKVKAITSHPEVARQEFTLAQVYFNMGNLKKAVELLDRAKKVLQLTAHEKEFHEIEGLQGSALVRMHDEANGYRMLNSSMAYFSPGNSPYPAGYGLSLTMYRYGEALESDGECVAAWEFYSEGLRLEKRRADSPTWLTKSFERKLGAFDHRPSKTTRD